jgi:branched-chain amino acid transport system permease protein
MLYREAGQFKTSYQTDTAIFPIRQDQIAIVVVVAVAFVAVPLLATPYIFTGILIPFLILALAALGLNILTGYAGQLSLGTAAFMAVGAFASYNFMLRIPGIPILLAFAGGGVIAALVGVLFGLPSLRIRGFYLAVATLAAQFFILWFLTKVGWVTNYSSSGVITAQQVVILGHAFTTPVSKYLLVLSIVALMALAAKNMARGNAGRSWMAVRDMDVAAEVIGIRLMRAKLLAFAVSSFYCGVAGALFAYAYLGTVEPEAFSLDLSFRILFMIIIGGMGTVLGAFLGAAQRHGAFPRQQHEPAHRREHDLQPRADGVRRAHHFFPDRRAARACAALADRQGKASPLAVPALISAPRVAAGRRSGTMRGVRIQSTTLEGGGFRQARHFNFDS